VQPPRKPSRSVSRYAAPGLFLLGVTIAVLLIRAGLGGSGSTTTARIPTATNLPATTTTRTTEPGSKRFYRVAAGDTFGSIAAKTGVSISDLERLNPGVSSNSLQVGQQLRVH
jgi:LysM repeat protein